MLRKWQVSGKREEELRSRERATGKSERQNMTTVHSGGNSKGKPPNVVPVEHAINMQFLVLQERQWVKSGRSVSHAKQSGLKHKKKISLSDIYQRFPPLPTSSVSRAEMLPHWKLIFSPVKKQTPVPNLRTNAWRKKVTEESKRKRECLAYQWWGKGNIKAY